jgi:hypothetical protein
MGGSSLGPGLESGALLPTPITADSKRSATNDRSMSLSEALLPTPTANDWKNAGYQKGLGDKTYPTLPGAVGSAPTSPRSIDGPRSSDGPHPTHSPTDGSTPASSSG